MKGSTELYERLIEAQAQRADHAEATVAALLARVAFLEERIVEQADAVARKRRDDADRKRNVRGMSTDNDRNVHGMSTDIPLDPPPSPFPPTPPITTSSPAATTTTPKPPTASETAQTEATANVERAAWIEVFAAVPEAYHADLDSLMARIPATANSSRLNRVVAWGATLNGALQGMGGPAVTGEQLGQAVRDFNANGEIVATRFRGYLSRPREAVPISAGPAAYGGNGQSLKGDGLAAFARFRESVETVYVLNNPDDPGAGGFNARRIRPDVMSAAPEAARRALAAIGGERALVNATDTDVRFMSSQFAAAYSSSVRTA